MTGTQRYNVVRSVFCDKFYDAFIVH